MFLTRIVVLIVFFIIVSSILKWTQQKRDDKVFDDYSNPKPPLYVYFYTSGINVDITIYFISAGLISALSGALFYKVTDNFLASCLLTLIVLYSFKQYVVVRSIRRSQEIDYDLPSFLITFESILQQINNPIFALGQAVKYAHKSYQKPLQTMFIRLQNGQDPSTEIFRIKRSFRNRILRNFLDDFEEDLRRGSVLQTTIHRHIDRSEDRKRYAAERRIETYSGVLIIYGGLLFEAVGSAVFALARPDWFRVFVEDPIGKFGVLVIVMISGFMILAAQRLILLSEG